MLKLSKEAILDIIVYGVATDVNGDDDADWTVRENQIQEIMDTLHIDHKQATDLHDRIRNRGVEMFEQLLIDEDL
jgi:hypothetical protein